MSDDRIAELEARLAFVDELVEQLNAVVARQDRDIAGLKQQVRALAQRLKEAEAGMAAASPPSASDEVPPHY